tara:strand:+ start:227 stop:730 length:504 start_codon:yes stop_codon:yes gene_type:complete
MSKDWSYLRQEWIKNTSLQENDAKWALEVLIKSEKEFHEIEIGLQNNEDIYSKVRNLKKKVRQEILSKESSLDDIALNTSTSNKLQISVPSNINYLLKVWAAAEGRDLSSVAFQCLETGLREMKSKGSLPAIAIDRYDSVCKRRIALAEINNLVDKYESQKRAFTND